GMIARPLRVAIVLSLSFAAACAGLAASHSPIRTVPGGPTPPVATKKQHVVTSPAGDRSDEYYWLRDDTRQSPEVLGYLKAENAYKDALLAPLTAAKQQLLEEIVARIPQEDETVPARERGYEYWTRFVRGGEYPIHLRKKLVEGATEEVLLDGNAMAQGHDFFQMARYAVSDDGTKLAWAEDKVGRRQYVVRIKDLASGQLLADQIPNADPFLAWAADGQTVLYIEKDPVTLLGRRVRRHTLGDDPSRDAVVYEEADPSFYISLRRSRSGRYIDITVGATDTSEQRIARADDPALAFEVLIPRQAGHEYEAEDFGDHFVMRTNRGAPNFKIVAATREQLTDPSTWRELVPHPSAGFVEGFAVFRDFLAYVARADGLSRVYVKGWSDNASVQVPIPEASYSGDLGENREVDSPSLRFKWSSLKTPPSIADYDPTTQAITLRKREWAGDGFDPARYETEFLRATARDGTLIPVSIVYPKGRPKDGRGALHVTGYGAYGINDDPTFTRPAFSLLDRGVAYAILHVRGGQELGRVWYEQGRQLQKKNTFTDFVDATDFLVKQGYAAHDRVTASGGSAGGLLMGAIANMAPDRYTAIAAHVPFVDVVTTMLDESIPLTTNEFDEWGNPKQKSFYDYILSYSPYDNVRAQVYPALYVTTGLWDSQVQYWEPLKWIARLRAHAKGDRPLVLRANTDAGHGGKSGRFRAQEQTAEQYAFLLDQLGVRVATRP
ncbi:MAG: S9 family peptidase, partial [Polyangiaceae bacterium]